MDDTFVGLLVIASVVALVLSIGAAYHLGLYRGLKDEPSYRITSVDFPPHPQATLMPPHISEPTPVLEPHEIAEVSYLGTTTEPINYLFHPEVDTLRKAVEAERGARKEAERIKKKHWDTIKRIRSNSDSPND